jgi:hypothetical protein
MSTKFYFRANFIVLVDDITNGQCSNFTDTHPGENGKDKRQPVALGMSRCLDNSEYTTNIIVGQDGLKNLMSAMGH